MKQLILSSDQINELYRTHRLAKDKASADRMKSIYLLSQGMSLSEIAKVLMMEEDTVRQNRKRYKEGGILGLLNNPYMDTSNATAQL